jgi:molybdopterin molybdotransferase
MPIHKPTLAGAQETDAVSVDTARAWIDRIASPLTEEKLSLAEAVGRILAADCRAGKPIPDRNRSAIDGFAVQARESVGAGAYNALSVRGIPVALGDAMPTDMDAVVPLGSVEPDGLGGLMLIEPVVRGGNVEPQGVVAQAGALLVPRSALLAPHHLGLLAMADIVEVIAVRRPRVLILLGGPPRAQNIRDSNGTMIQAAVRRDGGDAGQLIEAARDRQSLARAIALADADIVLVIGGTGVADDDHAAAALSDAGEIVFRGVALRPGETATLGRIRNGVPVMLLPGKPAACLWTYEMFAGGAIRRLAGRNPDLPFRRRTMVLGRKIVSAIGLTEICSVRLAALSDTVEPLPSFTEIGLMAAAGGDGFVIVPETSEGYPAGAIVIVYLYESCQQQTEPPQ